MPMSRGGFPVLLITYSGRGLLMNPRDTAGGIPPTRPRAVFLENVIIAVSHSHAFHVSLPTFSNQVR